MGNKGGRGSSHTECGGKDARRVDHPQAKWVHDTKLMMVEHCRHFALVGPSLYVAARVWDPNVSEVHMVHVPSAF